MATELGEGVEDTTRDNTRTITGDEDCLTSEVIERKKKSVIWMFFSVHKEDKSKAICLTCKEKVSRVGAIPRILIQLTFENTCRVIATSIRNFVRRKLQKETKLRSEQQPPVRYRQANRQV